MFLLYFFNTPLVLRLSPVGQERTSQLIDLLHGHRFSFIGTDTVGDGLFHLVSNSLHALIHVRMLREALVQSFCPLRLGRFIFHELLNYTHLAKVQGKNCRSGNAFAPRLKSHPASAQGPRWDQGPAAIPPAATGLRGVPFVPWSHRVD